MNPLIQYTPLKFFVQSFWRDEAFSYLLAKKGILDILQLTAKDFTPPAYYVLLHMWMGIFGSSEIAIRSLSLFFFVGTAYFMYDIMTEICGFGKKISFMYLALIFLNPLLSYYAFEARPYAMVAFCATASCYAFIREKKKLYLITTTLGLYTHYFMVFILMVQGIYMLFYYPNVAHIRERIKRLFIPTLIALPWMLYMFKQRTVVGESFWIPKPTSSDFLYLLSTLYTGYEKWLGWDIVRLDSGYTTLTRNIAIFLTVILIFGSGYILLKTKKIKRVALFLTLWGLFPPIAVFFLSLFSTSVFLPRYLILAVPGVLLLLFYIIEVIPVRARALILIVLFVLTIQYQAFQIKYREKSNVRQTYAAIKASAQPDDVIYVKDELDFHLAQYYFDEQRVYIYNKNYDEVPNYVGKVLMPKERFVYHYPILPKKAYVVKGKEYYVRSQY